MAVFDIALVYRLPRCLRGGMPTGFWRWAFINFQNGFVSFANFASYLITYKIRFGPLNILSSLPLESLVLSHPARIAIPPGSPVHTVFTSGLTFEFWGQSRQVLSSGGSLTGDKMWSLNLIQFSSIEKWSKWVMNEATNVLASSLILHQSVLENIYTVGFRLVYRGDVVITNYSQMIIDTLSSCYTFN